MKRQRARVRKDNKIRDEDLVRLLVLEKWSRARIADHFRVSRPAITQRLRLLGFTSRTLVGGAEVTHTTVDAHIEAATLGGLDVARRLEELDRTLGEELAFLQGRGAGNEDKREALTEKLLATISEIRKTSGTWLEMARVATAISEIAAFRELVLGVLAEAAPELRVKVLAKLAQARSGHRMLSMASSV